MSPPVLAAVGVTKTYRLGKQEIAVLRGVNLHVQQGEILALLGASGAGKSTLLHVLGLLDPPTAGEVRFDGKPVHHLPVRERARLRHAHTGFVFQFYHLIPELTALQNVMLARMMSCSVLQYWGQRRAARATAWVTPPAVTARPSWPNSRATLPAGSPNPLLHQAASATARGPSWTAAAPRASEVCSGWRG